MTAKQERQIIFIGTIVGLGIIVSVYLWLQNYLFPPNMGQQLEAFQRQVEQEAKRPFHQHYDSSLYYYKQNKHDLALAEAKKALENARPNDVGMAHSLLFDIYLAMEDVANAEKELEWDENRVRERGTGNNYVNATETVDDRLMSYRRRIEELKKVQQQKSNSSSTIAPRANERASSK